MINSQQVKFYQILYSISQTIHLTVQPSSADIYFRMEKKLLHREQHIAIINNNDIELVGNCQIQYHTVSIVYYNVILEINVFYTIEHDSFIIYMYG